MTTTIRKNHAEQEAEQASIEANIASIMAVPVEQMPWPAVRSKLLAIALAGGEVYAYRPAFHKCYVIWHRQEDPAVDARFTPRDWAIKYGYTVE